MANLSIFVTLILISILPYVSLSFSPDSPTDRRVLILLDDFSVKSSHSIFFSSLKSRGFVLDFKLSDDPKLSIQRYGQYLYDALILFSPSTEKFGGALDLGAVLDFVDSGHDLIVAADASASDLIRSIATECGVDFDEDPSAKVIDHKCYAVSENDGDHTLIASDSFIQSDVILGKSKIEAPILFRGIAHSVNPTNGMARNDARVMISGSLDMFSDRFFTSDVQKAENPKYEKSGNEQFVSEISKWVFHERGHLKGLYHTSFTVPDVYGVFQFKVEYHRLGYSSLSLSKQIPVRPFRHNEYERFITTAFPYYGASFTMMAGFAIFSFAYLYNK
ncbi:hypothetical protein HS088_TW14G00200 [Tripterygium wilfordii]|uniref:Dolichyl-diphosphooligosaccharide--protein glycosyltransferase 48 kDa subunit n=1 Tax=Tripterygium wilfordii TaxID=458696 RepID=A0A7J7CQB4_TRIWF|nr:hypothetical protein HS088_TW14G00200 [Tripterygium wilfordii]